MWGLYLTFYGLFLFSTVSILETTGGHTLSSLIILSPALKLLCFLNFLNLAGLPPFSGFLVKLVLLKVFLNFVPASVVLLLLYLSLCVLFSYLVLTFYSIGASGQFRLGGQPEVRFYQLCFSLLCLCSLPVLGIFSI